MTGGDGVFRCPECGAWLKATAIIEKDASYIRTEDDQWIKTYPPQSAAKPFSTPTRLRLPSYFTEGLALGTGATVILSRLGLGLPAGAWVSVWVGAVSFGTYAALWIERYRARRPRVHRERTTLHVHSDGSGGGGGDDAIKEKLDFPGPVRLLQTFAAEYADIGTSEASWTGGAGKLSRAEYYIVRDWLLKHSLAVWNSEKGRTQGWRVRAKGGAVLRGLSPLPRTETRP